MLHMQTRPTQVVVSLDEHLIDRANLWIPEIVEIGDSGRLLPFARNPEHPVVWVEREDGCLAYDLEIPGILTLSARIQAAESGFGLEMEIGNLTSGEWGGVHACVCLQLTLAASYLDLTWKRTHCVVDGRVVDFARMEHFGGGKPYYCYAMLDGHRAPLRHRDPYREGAKWRFTRESPDAGFICVTSADGSRTVWTGWEEVQYLQVNAASAFGCIHANPFYGDIGPGERVLRRGRVGLAEGGAEAARDAFAAEFGAIQARPTRG